MSQQPLHHQSKREHGTRGSYIVGFLLSILCTLVPYSLVVNHTISGSALLPAIMTFAIAQMFIQITFFLHLGRGPKPLYNITFFASTVSIIILVVGGSLYIMKHLHYNMAPSEVTLKLANDEGIAQVSGKETGACSVPLVNHQVVIGNGKVVPAHVDAHFCDTITFISADNVAHVVAFGEHPQHTSYAGEEELGVRTDQNAIITLSVAGAYQFHDHLHPSLTGDFTVSKEQIKQ